MYHWSYDKSDITTFNPFRLLALRFIQLKGYSPSLKNGPLCGQKVTFKVCDLFFRLFASIWFWLCEFLNQVTFFLDTGDIKCKRYARVQSGDIIGIPGSNQMKLKVCQVQSGDIKVMPGSNQVTLYVYQVQSDEIKGIPGKSGDIIGMPGSNQVTLEVCQGPIRWHYRYARVQSGDIIVMPGSNQVT